MQWILTKIRWLQLKRQFRQAGIFYTGLLLFAVALVETAICRILQQNSYTLYIAAGILLMVLSIHLSRRDIPFIWKQVTQPRSNIFWEYTVFALPVTALFLFRPEWYYFPVLLLGFWVIAQLKVKSRKQHPRQNLSAVISARQFEWLAGVRGQPLAFVLLLALAWATCWMQIVPLVFLWLMMIVVCSFYQYGESLQMLYAAGDTARQLLQKKIYHHGKITGFLLAPVLLINSLIFPSLAWVNLIFFVLQLSLLFLAILIKYATYEPEKNLKGNSLIMSICSVLLLIPVAFLIPLLLLIRYYKRAIRRLKYYFHDPC